MKKALIISTKKDAHADYVIKQLSDLGHQSQVIRLNTDDMFRGVKYAFNGHSFKISIQDSQKFFRPDEIGCVWYRRTAPLEKIIQEETGVADIASQHSSNCINSVLEALYSVLCQNSCFINDFWALRRSYNKLLQLEASSRLDIKFPTTLISNDKSEIERFCKGKTSVCVKPLDVQGLLWSSEAPVLMARAVSTEKILSLPQGHFATPVIFQDVVEGDFECRAVVMGEKTFIFRAAEKMVEDGEIDIRLVPLSRQSYTRIFREDIENAAKKITNEFGLFFSSIDIIVKGDVAYFVDLNPNGQWLWLELMTGVQISNALTSKIVGSMKEA